MNDPWSSTVSFKSYGCISRQYFLLNNIQAFCIHILSLFIFVITTIFRQITNNSEVPKIDDRFGEIKTDVGWVWRLVSTFFNGAQVDNEHTR